MAGGEDEFWVGEHEVDEVSGPFLIRVDCGVGGGLRRPGTLGAVEMLFFAIPPWLICVSDVELSTCSMRNAVLPAGTLIVSVS